MNWVQTIAKNMAALATGQAAYRLGLVALEIVLARALPPAQFGEFASALGFANMFLVFMDLGVALGLVRVVSRHDPIAPAYFGGSLLLRGAVAAILFPVMLALSFWLHPASRVPVVAVLGIFVVASSLQEVLASVHQGLGEMEWIAGFRLGIVLATGAGVALALARGGALTTIGAAFALVAVAGLAAWYAVTTRRLPPRFEASALRPVLSDTLLYGTMYVASMLTFRQGVVVLSFFRSDTEVAYFAAGYRLLEVTSKVPLVLSMALVPEMFRSARDNRARLERLFRVQVRMLGLGVLPLAVGVALFAPEIVRAIYGPGYEGAVPVLRVFAASLPLSFLNGALGDTLTARDLQRRRTRIHLVVLGLGIAVTVPFSWAAGAPGTAVALLCCEATLFLLLAWSVHRRATSLAPLRKLTRVAVAAAAAGAAALLLQPAVHSLILAPAFVTLYVLLCFGLRAIRPEEVRQAASHLLPVRRGRES